jgi:hypothetical protein
MVLPVFGSRAIHKTSHLDKKAFGVALNGMRELCHYFVAVNGGRASSQAREEHGKKS